MKIVLSNERMQFYAIIQRVYFDFLREYFSINLIFI